MKTTVVNLFAGPGAGKSTFCAGLFAALKWDNVSCEMALEYAKDMVWQNSLEVLNNQLYVFGKQQNRLHRLNEKVKVVITDSPLLNSLVYDANTRTRTKSAFIEMVLAEHAHYDSLNFFITRRKKYCQAGRLQDRAEALALDKRIMDMLIEHHIPFDLVEGIPTNINNIIERLEAHRPDLHKIDD